MACSSGSFSALYTGGPPHLPVSCRRQGLAKQLMDHLESVTERDEGYFVDLFVRESNVNAINMYKKVRIDIISLT